MSNRRRAAALLCEGCSGVSQDWDRIPHFFRMSLIYLERCNECIKRKDELCSENLRGIHTEIYVEDESDEWDDRVFFPRVDGLTIGQIGYCSACKWPFFWSTGRLRWVPMTVSNSDLQWRVA